MPDPSDWLALPNDWLALPRNTLVLVNETMQLIEDLGPAVPRRPVIAVSIITPDFAQHWMRSPRPSRRRAAVLGPWLGQDQVIVAGKEQLEFIVASGQTEPMLILRLKSDAETDAVRSGMEDAASAIAGHRFRDEATPIVVLDMHGRVVAGAGVLADLREATVAVIAVVDPEDR